LKDGVQYDDSTASLLVLDVSDGRLENKNDVQGIYHISLSYLYSLAADVAAGCYIRTILKK
jgi:hypothetical protein